MERPLDADHVIRWLSARFESQGAAQYLGESVTLAEHMLQCATLAEADGLSDEIVVAALLHDIGHLSGKDSAYSPDDTHDRRHQESGARIIENTFPADVVDAVRSHVAAKRYLCAIDPAYADELSIASQHSLQLQGGPMAEDEWRAFEQRPNLDMVIAVRRYDDLAKIPERQTPAFSHFWPRLQRVLNRKREA